MVVEKDERVQLESLDQLVCVLRVVTCVKARSSAKGVRGEPCDISGRGARTEEHLVQLGPNSFSTDLVRVLERFLFSRRGRLSASALIHR